MKISLGGDLIHYLCSVGLFSALKKFGLVLGKDYEVNCCGFSCIPAILFLDREEKSYVLLSNMWNEAKHLFKTASKSSLSGFVRDLGTIFKVKKRLPREENTSEIMKFVTKWLPNLRIDESSPIKVYAYNLYNQSEELLFGDLYDIIAKVLVYPPDFPPVAGYISLAWVFGIPLGDVAVHVSLKDDLVPKKGLDYIFLSYLARYRKVLHMRLSSFKFTFEIASENSLDFSRIAAQFFKVAQDIICCVLD